MERRDEISERSSLRYYRDFKKQPGLEDWLKDMNHTGIHTKLLLRAGKLLNTSHPRPVDNPLGHCRACQQQTAETRAHFLLLCPTYEDLRQAWARDLKTKVAAHREHASALTALLNHWALNSRVNLAPSPSSPTFLATTDPSHSTVQICSLLHPNTEDIPLPDQDDNAEVVDEQAKDILKTRRGFEKLVEKSTRTLLHKMIKLRQRLTTKGDEATN